MLTFGVNLHYKKPSAPKAESHAIVGHRNTFRLPRNGITWQMPFYLYLTGAEKAGRE